MESGLDADFDSGALGFASGALVGSAMAFIMGYSFLSLLCADSLVHSFSVAPLPVPNLRHVLAVFVDVVFVLDELVLHLLLEVGALGT